MAWPSISWARCRQPLSYAIENDPGLAGVLRGRFARSGNVTIYQADFFDFPLPRADYKVFSNIPFNVTAQIVAKLTTAANPPLDSYLGVQREAAQRFIGEPRGTLWATLLKPWFDTTIVHRFRRSDFDPVPQVDVVMLRLRKRGPPLVRQHDARHYRDFVTYCFTARRPHLRATLEALFCRRSGRSIVVEVGIGAQDTPSILRFDQWLALFDALKATGNEATALIAKAERRLRTQQRGLKKVHRTRATARTQPNDASEHRKGGSDNHD